MQTKEHHPLNDYLLTAANHILKQTIKTNSPPTANNTLQTTQLHPLSLNKPLQATKQNTLGALTSIQQTLNSFKQLLPQQQSQSGNHLAIRKLFALLRESSHHLNLLIQSNSLINLNQTHLHPPSTYLNPSIILQNLPADQRFPTTLHLIESVTRHIGLESFQDSDHSNLLTIAGKLIVIDVEISPHQTDSNPVTRSKFSYTFAGELEPRRDALIDQELTQLLSNVHLTFQSEPPHSFCDIKNLQLVQTSLNGFTESLLRLKELDELMKFFNHSNDNDEEPGSPSSSVDFFRVFRQLLNDYHHSYEDYSHKIKHSDSKQPLPKHRLSPTGIPLTLSHQFKLELVYHCGSCSPLNQNASQLSHGLKISISPTPLSTHQETCSNNSDLDLSSGNKNNKIRVENKQPETTKTLFTAYFYPPLVVSRHTAATLARISCNNNLSSSVQSQTFHHVDEHENLLPKNEVWIENLLVLQAMLTDASSPLLSRSEDELNWLDESSWKNQKFGKKFEANGASEGSKSIKQIYSFLEGTQVESGDLNHRVGFSISKVGFNDFDSLLQIVKTCQRQSILNELFQSCFNPNCYLEHQDQLFKEKTIDVENDFDTFHTVNFDENGVDGQVNSSQVVKDEEKNKIFIDIMMNQTDYSITIQFILPKPTRKKESEKNEENNNNSNDTDMDRLNDDEATASPVALGKEKINLISWNIQVTEDLEIKLTDFNQSISIVSDSSLVDDDEPDASNTNDNHNDNSDAMIIDDSIIQPCILDKEYLQSQLIHSLSIPSFLNLVLLKLI